MYVWRNADGTLMYSDKRKPGAVEIEINESKSISSAAIDTRILIPSQQEIAPSLAITITQPLPEATIRSNTGSVTITSQVTPVTDFPLYFQLLLNGTPKLSPQKQPNFQLENLDRGEHHIQIQLIDDKGKIIALSKPVTFFMHKASVFNG